MAAIFVELEARWPGGAIFWVWTPSRALTGWAEVEVRMVPESAADAGCSVTGAYLNDDGLPVIAIAESVSPGRRAFTGDHELGHHLQQTTDHLIKAWSCPTLTAAHWRKPRCNGFAARLLIPDQLTTRHIGPAGPTAHDICTCGGRHASRQAVCARAAERLPGRDISCCSTSTAGHLQLVPGRAPDRSRRRPVRIPVVADQLRHGGTQTGKTRIAYRDGITGSELYRQTTDLDGYTVAVAVTDHAPWLTFSPVPRHRPDRQFVGMRILRPRVRVMGAPVQQVLGPEVPGVSALRLPTCQ